MCDDLLEYCLVTFTEAALFLEVSEDDIVNAIMAVQKHKVVAQFYNFLPMLSFAHVRLCILRL